MPLSATLLLLTETRLYGCVSEKWHRLKLSSFDPIMCVANVRDRLSWGAWSWEKSKKAM